MEDLIKKVSYLKGYADGLDISPKSDEGKLIIKLLDLLGEMADKIEEMDSDLSDTRDALDELDTCVFDLADDFYGDGVYDDDLTRILTTLFWMTMTTTTTTAATILR